MEREAKAIADLAVAPASLVPSATARTQACRPQTARKVVRAARRHLLATIPPTPLPKADVHARRSAILQDTLPPSTACRTLTRMKICRSNCLCVRRLVKRSRLALPVSRRSPHPLASRSDRLAASPESPRLEAYAGRTPWGHPPRNLKPAIWARHSSLSRLKSTKFDSPNASQTAHNRSGYGLCSWSISSDLSRFLILLDGRSQSRSTLERFLIHRLGFLDIPPRICTVGDLYIRVGWHTV
jgi:hypothetical protein